MRGEERGGCFDYAQHRWNPSPTCAEKNREGLRVQGSRGRGGRITEALAGRGRAYLHANLRAEKEETVDLVFSSAEELFIWVNGEPDDWLYPMRLAWFDFWKNPEHDPGPAGADRAKLRRGDNQLLILVNGGTYAGGGFWVHRRPTR